MAASLQDSVADILQAAESGAADPVDQLVPLVYGTLRELAHRQLARGRRMQTLATTDLVHEAYLKLAGQSNFSERGRAYFYGAAARAMRQVLVDRARRRGRQKRGGDWTPTSLDDNMPAVAAFADELIDLNDALEELATLNPRQVRVVECRFFADLTVEETAGILGVSPRTVKSDWALARAWLYRWLSGERDE